MRRESEAPPIEMGGFVIYIDTAPLIPLRVDGRAVPALATSYGTSPLGPLSLAMHPLEQIDPDFVEGVVSRAYTNGRYPLVSAEVKTVEDHGELAIEDFPRGSKRRFMERQGYSYKVVSYTTYDQDENGYWKPHDKQKRVRGTARTLTKIPHYTGGIYKNETYPHYVRERFVPSEEDVKSGLLLARNSRLLQTIFDLIPDDEPVYEEWIPTKTELQGMAIYESPMVAYAEANHLIREIK